MRVTRFALHISTHADSPYIGGADYRALGERMTRRWSSDDLKLELGLPKA